MTLVLNEHLDPGDIEANGLLNILPSEKPTKYLGILFGHRLPKDLQIQQLNDKFLAAFQLWGGRARTIQGRKLIVNTMLLSMLWHVTAVVQVPQAMIDVWQQMVNKYVLGRKTTCSDHHRPLICRTWQFDKRLGLGIPHVASKIRTQRLLRLQLLMAPEPTQAPTPWKLLVQRQFSRTWNKLYRSEHPFDFLLYYPNRSSKWLYLWELHPLWIDIWRQGALIPMSQRMTVPPSLHTVLNLPVWLTSYEPMHTGRTGHLSNLAKNPTIRRWCRHGVNNGLRCLKDFLTHQGSWPTKAAFVARMLTNSPAAQVQINSLGSMEFVSPESATVVYTHLTKLFDSVLRHHDVRPGAPLHDVPTTGHPFVALVKDQFIPFERWPKRLVARLAYHAPFEVRPHPMSTRTRSEMKDLVQHVRLARQVCRASPPVQGDVWFRLLMQMLPVNSRFYYMQPQQPTAVCCVYQDCGAVETLHHAFHTCGRIHPLWSFHASAWRCYGINFAWASIVDLDRFQVNSSSGPYKEALFALWSLLCASTLHSIWTYHNATKYDAKSSPPTEAWIELTFVNWMASIRRWLRLRDNDDPDRVTALQVLQVLLRRQGYQALWAKYPFSLSLSPRLSSQPSD
jgi:hypothetical protein